MGSFYGNGVIFKESLDRLKFYSKTTAEWDAESDLISEENTLYIYTDYKTQGTSIIPGLKIGDGTSYLIDLPFSATGEKDDGAVESVSKNGSDITVTKRDGSSSGFKATQVFVSTTQPVGGTTGDVWMVLI